MTESRDVLIEVEGGHVHRGFERQGVLFVDEGCNVDDAAHRSEISTDELANRAPWLLCARTGCFPTGDSPRDSSDESPTSPDAA